MVGIYRVSPELAFRVHLYEGRLFAKPEGAPMAELELLPIGEGKFYSPIFPLEVSAQASDDGSIDSFEVQMGPMKMVGRREEP